MLNLKLLTSKNISQITDWFADPETQKYLGKTDWIESALVRMTASVRKEFRGGKVLKRLDFIAYDNSLPAGYIEAEVYDKYTICSGKDNGKNP